MMNRLYLIIGIVLVVLGLGVGTYFIYNKYNSGSKPPEPAKQFGSIGTEVDMLIFLNSLFPTYQFVEAEADLCLAKHWHARKEKVYGLKEVGSTEIVSLSDPSPSECGFGKVSDVKRAVVLITDEEQKALVEATLGN